MLFTDLPLTDSLLEGLEAMNFKETTPVQEQAIPVILEKKDVIACAQTGTGKTAAFLLPLLNNLQNDHHDEGKVNAIIMAPTRELAQQIDQMMEGFSYYTPFSSVAVYGGNDGEAWEVQKRGLQSGADVVISTPGRLLSHINLYNIDFSGVKYFILDEADRMLDMGFHEDIMKIEKLLPKDRQTIMFSATMPPKIQQLAKTIQRDPVEISIAIARPPETILQSAYICYEAQKIGIVKSLFMDKKPNKVILFSGSKMKVKEIAKTLHRMKLSVGEMHSDLDQSQRDHVMHEFRNERVDILVATDIVARGIDIDDISLVINFDVPYDVEDYVHRIGRTARAGDSGMAITFVAPDEQYRFSLIEKFLEKEIYRIPIPSELGEAPEYNPVRDQRRRGASVRSRGAGRKGRGERRDSQSQSSRKSRGSTRLKRSENDEKAGKVERNERNERTERLEKTGKPVRPKKTGQTTSAEGFSTKDSKDSNDQKHNKQGPQEQGSQKQKPRKQGSQKQGKEIRTKGERQSQPQRKEGSPPKKVVKKRTSDDKGTKPSQTLHASEKKRGSKQGGNNQSVNKQSANRQSETKRSGSGQSNAKHADEKQAGRKRSEAKQSEIRQTDTRQSATKQVDAKQEENKKTKKWSWWPFGKK